MRVEIALEVLGIAAVVVAVSGLAEKLRFSAPLLLLLVGVSGSYLPFIDEPQLSISLPFERPLYEPSRRVLVDDVVKLADDADVDAPATRGARKAAEDA